jgi:monofunctional chorismate mutase
MSEIQQLRKQVDEVDDKILKALCERAQICKAIGAAKKKQGLTVRDTSRESEVYRRVKAEAAKFGLDARQVEAVFHEIVNMCSAVQE